jgi:hypothetical protein
MASTVVNVRRLPRYWASVDRLLLVVLLTTCIVPARAATRSPRFRFVAFGYLCVRQHMGLLVDTNAPPQCHSAVGIGFGRMAKSLRFASVRQGDWKVSRTPLKLNGEFVEGKPPKVTSAVPTMSRRDRLAESLGTIELSRFTVAPKRRVSREVVFASLPAFAEAAPDATVRTARVFDGRTYTYGAQVRDPGLAQPEVESVVATAKRIGIPVFVNTSSALGIDLSCKDLNINNQQLVGDVVTTAFEPVWTQNGTRWSASITACDEPTQVYVTQAPIVASLVRPLDIFDTVIDASIRIVPATTT